MKESRISVVSSSRVDMRHYLPPAECQSDVLVPDDSRHSVTENMKGRECQPTTDGKGGAARRRIDMRYGERADRQPCYRVHVRVAVKVAPAEALAIRTPAPASTCRPKATST